MKLWLMRHGYAGEPSADPIIERTRPLDDVGVVEVQAVANELKRRGEAPRVIFASDVIRAQQTADIVASTLGSAKGVFLIDELNPFYPMANIVRELLEDPDSRKVMIVGHHDNIQPFLARWCLKSLVMTTSEVIKVRIDRRCCDEGELDASMNEMLWRLSPGDLDIPELGQQAGDKNAGDYPAFRPGDQNG